MPLTTHLLHGGRVQPDPHQPAVPRDILIGADGRITALLPAGTTVDAARVTELNGRLVLPGLVDAHQHLDKSRTVSRVPNPRGDLEGAVTAFRAYAATMTHDDIMQRAERTVAASSAHGTVALRSHANIDPETGCRGIAALVELRERWRTRIRLQVVAFLSGSAPDSPHAGQWLAEALALGADVIGGTPSRAVPSNKTTGARRPARSMSSLPTNGMFCHAAGGLETTISTDSTPAMHAAFSASSPPMPPEGT